MQRLFTASRQDKTMTEQRCFAQDRGGLGVGQCSVAAAISRPGLSRLAALASCGCDLAAVALPWLAQHWLSVGGRVSTPA